MGSIMSISMVRWPTSLIRDMRKPRGKASTRQMAVAMTER